MSHLEHPEWNEKQWEKEEVARREGEDDDGDCETDGEYAHAV